ncbi:MAG: type II toxin-antitoxin system RelE/ParE family toxin [Bdellovibrio sp.]|nr:type II toxin-antitoxin system RelE/ParE family toxin [Bdellovibrio sp.]
MAIQLFSDHATEVLFKDGTVKKAVGWHNVSKVALRKLDMLHYAAKLTDLKSPPNNRLEALKGKLKGKYSIRINVQWRIVFRWTDLGPTEVEIMDYHK